MRDVEHPSSFARAALSAAALLALLAGSTVHAGPGCPTCSGEHAEAHRKTARFVIPLREPPRQPDQSAPAQPPELDLTPRDPKLSAAAARLLEASYFTPDEKRDLRIFHGVWKPEDLAAPALKARAALITGALNDESLRDPATPALDRAEAHLRRGEPAAVLALTAEPATFRAARLRAEALEQLGRTADAVATITPFADRLAREKITSAPELVEGVRGLMVLDRVRGPSAQDPAGDYRAMLAMLARARSDLDRFHWPAMLAEAELLLARDNRKAAYDAIQEVLALNPRCAPAWELLGRMAVDSFDLDNAGRIARRLEMLASPIDAGEPIGSEAEWINVHSAPSAIIRALGRMRQNDGDGAAIILTPMLAAFPEHRELRAMQAAAEARRYRFADVDRLLADYQTLEPGSARALLEVGRVLSEARQYAEAARYLEAAAELWPQRAEPWTELGLMEIQAARDDRALAALEKAVAKDPFNMRAGNSLALVKMMAGYTRLENEHFIIRHAPGIDAVLAPEMLEALEEIYARVTGPENAGIDYPLNFKTVIDVMPDHRAFAVRIAGITDIHTMAAATGPAIAMEAPREGPGHKIGVYDWVRVVRHEFVHTVTLARTNNRIPHWFTEAAAVHLEDAPRDFATCQLLAEALASGTLFDFDQINLAFVRPKKPTDRAQAYAQGHWMYQFMLERWGDRAPLDLMDLYAQGVSEPEAVTRILGISRDEFMSAFVQWATQQVIAWGLLPPPGMPTLAELVAPDALSAAVPEDVAAAPARSESPPSPPAPGAPAARTNPPPAPTPEQLARWLADYPTHPDLLALTLQLELDRAGDRPTPEMIPLLRRYAQARPVDPLPHTLLARLFLDSAGGSPADAIPHLEFLDVRETYSPAYAVELSRQYLDLGELDKAWAKAVRATRIAPFDADERELAATVALERGDLAMAERHIAALVAIEPTVQRHRARLDAVRTMRTQSR